MKRVYALQVRGGFEEAVKDWIVGERGFLCFLPLTIELGAGCLKSVLRFPGYVFAKFDVWLDPWEAIDEVDGAVKFLPVHCEAPSPCPIGLIEEMAGVSVAQPDPGQAYQLGDLIPVQGGPFAGHSGRMVWYDGATFGVEVYLLGARRVVEVHQRFVFVGLRPYRELTKRRTVRAPQLRRGTVGKRADAEAPFIPTISMA